MSSITDALKAKHPEATGDTIAEVIRTMDAGGGSGGGGVLNITLSVTTGEHNETIYRLDTTWKDIKDAFIAGKNVIFTAELDIGTNYGYVTSVSVRSYEMDPDHYETEYDVDVTGNIPSGAYAAGLSLVTNSEDGYPEYTSI